MPTFVMRITPDLMVTVAAMIGSETIDNPFGEAPFIVFTPVGPAEINVKIMTEDDLVELAHNTELEFVN
jgi:hypothetical protein